MFHKKYLPVGSVVGLLDDNRRLLVLGRQLYSETHHIIRDYAALEYPNGFVDASEKFVLFDQIDIETVYHYGYIDEKEMQLDALLEEAASAADDDD